MGLHSPARRRVFVGCPLAPEIAEQLAIWAKLELERFDLRLVPPRNLHVTLLFLGEVDDADLDAIKYEVERAPWPGIEVAVGELFKAGRGAVALDLDVPRQTLDSMHQAMGTNNSIPDDIAKDLFKPLPEGMTAEPWEREFSNAYKAYEAHRDALSAPWTELMARLGASASTKVYRDSRKGWGWPGEFHVTIARTRGELPQGLPAIGPSIKFRLDRVALYESQLSPSGASYKVLCERGPSAEPTS